MELKPEKFFFISICHSLLIVPYGIETLYGISINLKQLLLIVPYGIETAFVAERFGNRRTFNRTLWN